MGSDGYRLAAESTCTDGIILEVGSGVSTEYLVTVGPLVVTIDLEHQPMLGLPRCRYLTGRAEELLTRWHEPGIGDGRRVCFAWLDGWDWPYDHHVGEPWLEAQRARYLARSQDYSKQASQASHLTIATLLAPWVAAGGWVAFDDTWIEDSATWIQNGAWQGKGGTAVPYLLSQGFLLRRSGDIYHGFVLLEAPA